MRRRRRRASWLDAVILDTPTEYPPLHVGGDTGDGLGSTGEYSRDSTSLVTILATGHESRALGFFKLLA